MALVADTSRAQIHAALDEVAYPTVQVGAPVRVRLAGLPARTFSGCVSEVVDWQRPLWGGRRRKDEKVRPGKVFAAVIDLEGELPTCVGMSAIVEVLPGWAAPPVPAPGPAQREQQEAEPHGEAD